MLWDCNNFTAGFYDANQNTSVDQWQEQYAQYSVSVQIESKETLQTNVPCMNFGAAVLAPRPAPIHFQSSKAGRPSDYLKEDRDEFVDTSLSSKGITVIYRASQYKKRIRLLINETSSKIIAVS